MLNNSFFKTIPFLFFIVLFNSCDKEFNVVGEDIVGDNSFSIVKEEFPVVAYNQKIGPVQSNDLDINSLGTYDNPSFGKTKANFVTQVSLAVLSPAFDKSAKIKSAVLSIPYFFDSSQTKLDAATGNSTYVLDSIYGPNLAKMKLSVYESGYFMRDLDPEDQFTQPQKYYNNQYPEFAAVMKGVLLNDSSNKAQNELFFFDPAEHVVTTPAVGTTPATTTRSAPGMELNLNTAFFQSKIIGAPASVLADRSLFNEYFRGLMFGIENINNDPGNMAMINFKGGKITITYTETINSVDTDKTLVLNLSGHTVSFLDQSNIDTEYADATNPDNIDEVNGDPNLYLKGGEGSMSILKLFNPTDNHGLELTDGPNGVSDQLDDMRRNKYLVNQAEITFYLNSSLMKDASIPQRIYLYDFTNKQVLQDYGLDGSGSANVKNNRFVFGGIFFKQTEEKGGSYYKFRITEHVRNLVKYKDSTNVDLGLVVTENINKSGFYSLRDKTMSPFKVPVASVMNPLGTIVHGNNVADDKKRLKFEIYYTKAN